MRKTVIAYIKASLRRTWGRSKQRQGALKLARVERGKYECANCGDIVQRKNVQVDHIVPVGRFEGFDLFIERLFCDTKGLAVLCLKCHSIKTKKDVKSFKK
jgi:5-methylcytosine-specific restriction endonuclease McrA